MISALPKSIHREKHDKHFTVLSNQFIRTRIEGDKVNAKDILTDALSCTDDWFWSTANIAKRFDISPKKAQRLCTLLVKAGYAERRTVTDPKTGQFLFQHYIFFEFPADKKRLTGKTEQGTKNIKEIPILTAGQKPSAVSIKENHKQEKTTTDPPAQPPQQQPPQTQPHPPVAPPGAAAVSLADKKTALELKNKIDPERKSSVSLALISQMLLIYSISQITGLIEKINKNKLISNPGGYMRKILNEKAELPDPDAEKAEAEKARQAEIEKLKEEHRLTREAKENAKKVIFEDISDHIAKMRAAIRKHDSKT